MIEYQEQDESDLGPNPWDLLKQARRWNLWRTLLYCLTVLVLIVANWRLTDSNEHFQQINRNQAIQITQLFTKNKELSESCASSRTQGGLVLRLAPDDNVLPSYSTVFLEVQQHVPD